MRNPFARLAAGHPGRPSLRERAAALKASAARVIERATIVRDQPSQASLLDGSRVDGPVRPFRGSDGAAQDQGLEIARDRPRYSAVAAGDATTETAMGRHETFSAGSPLGRVLLSETTLGTGNHPDARLMDLEREFLNARAAYDAASARETEAHREFDRRERPYVEADKSLLMYPDGAVHWQAKYIRMILDGKNPGGSARDYELIRNTSRSEFERLIPLAEPRDERRDTLMRELELKELEEAREALLWPVDELAETIYQTQAHTLEGLAVKARVLKISEVDFGKRPTGDSNAGSNWHEIAFAEMADAIAKMAATGNGMSASGSFVATPINDPLSAASGVSETPDPIFGLIAAHELAYGQRLFCRAYEPGTPAERLAILAEERAYRALLHSPLTTDSGRIAYATAVLAREVHIPTTRQDGTDGRDHPLAVAGRNLSFGEHAREIYENGCRLDAAASPFEAPHTRDGSPSDLCPVDPIFDMIAEGRRLMGVANALYARPAFPVHEEQLVREEENGDALGGLWEHCDETILKTVPRTAAGCRELARFGVEYFESMGVAISDDEQAITSLIAKSPLL